MKGRRVLMVSGSDAHGTPITVRADAEKTSPLAVYQRYHATFLELFQQLGLTYDLFTSTHTENHFNVSQKMFLALLKNGYLYRGRQLQWYSVTQQRFLPDRYVEGTCYICGYPNTRSDQCDRCGNVLDPEKLINPRSRIDGSVPELRQTEHYFLDLAKLQPQITEFLRARESYWRPNVLRQSLGLITTEGLKGRPITRDLDWGIPVPVEGMEANASTCGLRQSSATSRRPLNGVIWLASRRHGMPGGTVRRRARTISSAKTTFPSMPLFGRGNSSAVVKPWMNCWAAATPSLLCCLMTFLPMSS